MNGLESDTEFILPNLKMFLGNGKHLKGKVRGMSSLLPWQAHGHSERKNSVDKLRVGCHTSVNEKTMWVVNRPDFFSILD